MPNNPRADLIYALLALDSYNRGYGSGIRDLGERGQLGSWSILTTSTDEFQQSAFNAGFYAIAYKDAVGNVVISYRGTDAPALGSDAIGGSDPANAYGLALGNTQDNTYFLSPLSLLLGSRQSGLAAQFHFAKHGGRIAA